MAYRKDTAFVTAVTDEAVELCVGRPEVHASRTCTGCGLCARIPGGERVALPRGKTPVLREGDVVFLHRFSLPYGVSLFLVFVFPVLGMAAAVAGGALLSRVFAAPVWVAPALVFCEAAAGAGAAFAVNRLVQAWTERLHPPYVEKKEPEAAREESVP